MAFLDAERGSVPANGQFLKFKEFEAELSLHIILDYGSLGGGKRYIDVPYERQCGHDQVPAG